jgi:opacity protein-like surface antigen
MRSLALAAFALTLATSGAAFADAIQVGNAHQAPVFATQSGNTTLVTGIGTANTAPVFAATAGNGQVVIDVGTAKRAPVFAQVGSATDLHLANR